MERVAAAVVLAVIVGWLGLGRRAAHASRRRRPGAILDVVDRVSLAPGAAAAVLRVGRRHVLVGIQPGRIVPLGRLAADDVAPDVTAAPEAPPDAAAPTRPPAGPWRSWR